MLTSILYKALAAVALCAALFGLGVATGRNQVTEDWEAAKAKQHARVEAVKTAQAVATVEVVTKYVDRVKVVRERGVTITKEVPVYVTKEADAHCTVPAGFVSLHDAAARGGVPDPPGGADAATSGIALSAVAGTVAGNYERCHENAEQLTALQSWIREMEKAVSNRGQ